MPKDFSHDTNSWKLFQIYFLDNGGKDAQGQYLWLEAGPKGKAINLCMSLNRCNMQWHRENGVDPRTNQLTARPTQKPDGTWWVELCQSKKNQRKNTRLTELLEQARQKQLEGDLIQVKERTLDPDEPGISPFEKIQRIAAMQQASTDAGAPAKTFTEEQRIQHQEEEDAKIRKLMGLD